MGLNRIDHDRSIAQTHLALLGWDAGRWSEGRGITNGELYIYRIADPTDRHFGALVFDRVRPNGWAPMVWAELDEPLLWELMAAAMERPT